MTPPQSNFSSRAAEGKQAPASRNLFKAGLTRTLIVWFLMLSLFPLTIVSGIAYLQSETAMRADTVKALTERTALQADFISNWFGYRFRDLRAQTENKANINFLQSLRAGLKESGQSIGEFVGGQHWEHITSEQKHHLYSLSRIYDDYYDIFLIDPAGNILFSVARESDLGTNLFTGPYKDTRFSATVSKSLSTGRALFSDLERYGPSGGSIAGFLTSVLSDDNGKIIGIYAVQIEVDRINEEIATRSENSTEISYLIGSDQILRSAFGDDDDAALSLKIDTAQSAQWKQMHDDFADPEHKSIQAMAYIGPKGQYVLGVHHAITLGNIQWGLISEIDEAQAFAPARKVAQVTAGLVGLVFIVVIIIAITLAQRLVNPLKKLVEVTESVAKGQLDHQVELGLSNEIGVLGDAFNEMLKVRRGYEVEIHEQHRQMKQALDELAEQRFALDQHSIVSTTDLRGTIIFVNDKFVEVSGYTREQLIGQNHRIVNSGFHPTEFFAAMYDCITAGNVWKGEFCNIAEDDLIYWVDCTIVPIMGTDNNPKGYISIRTDITARRLSEEKAQWLNHATHVKFNIIDALSTQTPLEERLDDAIDETFALTGLKLRGKGGVFVLDKEGEELSLCALRGDFGAPFVRNEIKRSSGDGGAWEAAESGDVIVRGNCSELHRYDHNGPDVELHGHYTIPLISIDLQGKKRTTGVLFFYTEPDPVVDDQRVALLLEIGELFSNAIMRDSVIDSYLEATREAEAASLAKSDFLANMSHEIRTPMNGVLGMLNLLQNSDLSARQFHQAKLARTSAEALLSLINDILDFSKIEAEKLDLESIDFDLRQMLGDFSESMALQAQSKGLELILDVTDIKTSHVRGDPGRLRQLLVNIVGNAIKFTETGEIVIRIGLKDADESGMLVYGYVSDTGIGIPQDKISSLFEAFS
ncbi:MAG: PAS domain-containing protein, partial [Pseudomonadales bacterium]|nr:PAS domain-containing protein [Pseudomonadales bacterium]